MLSRIKAILRDYDYDLFTRPYEVNIVGLRGRSTESNQFDDEIHVFYTKSDGKWNYHVFPATTDPGTYWLNNPAYPQGTAILPQGQYREAYAIGKHRSTYTALVQVLPLTVIRDYNRDSILDLFNGEKQTGLFGINIHRAEQSGTTAVIGRYSAGCQVFQNAQDFESFIALCRRHEALYGNRFTYTLIDFRAMTKVTFKRIMAGVTIAAGALLGWILKQQYL
ncbi:hypothetical protein [Dawidia soli]|uniref:Uncharacterized protein n=1 Tax=Dawidia soli TaxID=2782352 RepID=A0AAP2GEZ9_9BACT|nr:hypothetical protein [Dawidia soli]MBT1688879.1 hypothetical protein [Dawidia soli]